MIIDATKAFEGQIEEVQEEIQSILQKEIQNRKKYPDFDEDGGITITTQYTDENKNTFELSEKRVQRYPFSQADRSVKNKSYKIREV